MVDMLRDDMESVTICFTLLFTLRARLIRHDSMNITDNITTINMRY